jgi:hypothetical protein
MAAPARGEADVGVASNRSLDPGGVDGEPPGVGVRPSLAAGPARLAGHFEAGRFGPHPDVLPVRQPSAAPLRRRQGRRLRALVAARRFEASFGASGRRASCRPTCGWTAHAICSCLVSGRPSLGGRVMRRIVSSWPLRQRTNTRSASDASEPRTFATRTASRNGAPRPCVPSRQRSHRHENVVAPGATQTAFAFMPPPPVSHAPGPGRRTSRTASGTRASPSRSARSGASPGSPRRALDRRIDRCSTRRDKGT